MRGAGTRLFLQILRSCLKFHLVIQQSQGNLLNTTQERVR